MSLIYGVRPDMVTVLDGVLPFVTLKSSLTEFLVAVMLAGLPVAAGFYCKHRL